jgi:hypothetical protein
MAGAGYRTWTAGEVVTASNVQSYLQDQTVGVYAGTAARASAILSPSEGQISYRTDDDIVEAYDGTNWVPVAPADTAGLVHIKQETFSAVSGVSVNDCFNSTYDSYKVVISIIASTGANRTLRFRVSSDDTSANYSYGAVGRTFSDGAVNYGASGQTSILLPFSGTAIENILTFDVANPNKSLGTSLVGSATGTNSASPTVGAFWTFGGFFSTTTVFTGFSILGSAGTVTGTIDVWGYKA